MTSDKSQRVLAQLLDECVEQMLHGESVAACLARYPEHAAALAPLLQTVGMVRRSGGPAPRSPAAAASSRAQFLAAAEDLAAAAVPARRSRLAVWWDQFVSGFQVLRPLPAGLVAAMLCVVLVGLLTTGVITASATALPGDPLYRVKLATEQARLFLARDQAARDALDQSILNTRISEAQQIRALHRAVAEMPLAGHLDAFGPKVWLISGVPVQVDARTTIVGTPALGALVRGSVRAPGDGSLVALYLEVSPVGARPAASKPVGPPAAPAAAASTPTLTPSQATDTPTPTPRADAGALVMPSDVFPTRKPQRSAGAQPARPPLMPTPLQTVSLPASPTTAVTAAPTPAPTTVYIPNPPATRPVQKGHLTDAFVTNIDGNWWTVGGVTVEVDASTQIVGQPGLGDAVDVEMVLRPGQPPLALVITLRSRAPTPQPIEFTGPLQQKSGAIWMIYGMAVTVQADTVIVANPQVGDWVRCTAERYPDGSIRGTRIEKVSALVVEFSGVIESFTSGQWRVGGQTIVVPPDVLLSGAPPAIGRLADVRAEQWPDGRLVAKVMYVLPDTPTPGPVPTFTPTSTSAPPASNTAAPTVEPVPTNTPEPAATTPPPTDTPPPPTATDTPPPTDTPLPAPAVGQLPSWSGPPPLAAPAAPVAEEANDGGPAR